MIPLGQSKPRTRSRIDSRPKEGAATQNAVRKRGSDEYAKCAPREYQNLYRLHQNVTRTPPVPISLPGKPLFLYKNGDQPRDPFLGKIDEGIQRQEKSSMIDTGSSEDLPSPYTLIPQTTFHGGSVSCNNPEVWQQDLGALQACETDFSKLEDEIATGSLNGKETTAQSSIGKRSYSQCEDKLFASPGNPTMLIEERQGTGSLKDHPAESQEPELKKQRASADEDSHSIRPPFGAEDANPALGGEPAPMIRSGHPEWVYDFDPAFVAEFEDFVEFV